MPNKDLTLAERLPDKTQITPLKFISAADLNDFYVFNKPGSTEDCPGYVSSFSLNIGAQEGGSLRDYFIKKGLDAEYPVDEMICFGRLDKDTSGLLLLSKRNAYPRFLDQVLLNPFFNRDHRKTSKVYHASVKGCVDPNILKDLKTIRISGAKGSVFEAHIQSSRLMAFHDVGTMRAYSVVELEVNEGKYHQVKKMFYALGHPVRKGGLHRVKFAMLSLAAQPGKDSEEMHVGQIRRLFPSEREKMSELYNQWLSTERKRLNLSL